VCTKESALFWKGGAPGTIRSKKCSKLLIFPGSPVQAGGRSRDQAGDFKAGLFILLISRISTIKLLPSKLSPSRPRNNARISVALTVPTANHWASPMTCSKILFPLTCLCLLGSSSPFLAPTSSPLGAHQTQWGICPKSVWRELRHGRCLGLLNRDGKGAEEEWGIPNGIETVRKKP